MRSLSRSTTFSAAAVALLATASSLLAAPIDRDTDSLNDLWQLRHAATSLAASADTDGDGADNLAESVAGTDPRDARSRHRVESITTPAANTVELRWPTVAGKRYRPQVSRDLATWADLGSPQLGDGAAQTFNTPLATTFLTGGARASRWTDADWWLDKLKTRATSAVAPTEALTLENLSVPNRVAVGPYGQWVRGWILPPATGDYTFWIASDDLSELWLSTNDQPATKRRIASVASWTNTREWTKFPSQRSASIRLEAARAYYFEVFHIEYGGGQNLDIAWSGPALGTTSPTIIGAPHLSLTGQSLAAFAAGKPLFFRVSVEDADSDGDGANDYDEILAGFDPLNPTTQPRAADRDGILQSLAARSTITVGTAVVRAYETGGAPARVTFFRSGGLEPLTLRYSLSGTATPGVDAAPLSGTVVLPIGQTSVSVDLVALPDALVEPAETLTVTVSPDAGYAVGSPASTGVAIDDAPDVLYVAQLRPAADTTTGGFGTATLRLAGNELTGKVSLTFANLRATELAADFYVSTNGSPGPVALTLPNGQVSSLVTPLPATAPLTREQILDALVAGRLWARVRSTLFPDGEINGRLTTAFGWQTMPTPAAAPSAPVAASTDAEAARFLTQATYGPTTTSIQNLRTSNFSAWIDAQLAATPTYHLPYVQARRAELLARSAGESDGWQGPRNEAWWHHALTAPDQLRQRMAFALSQLFVISQASSLDGEHEGTTRYYDLLVRQAFGNYRQLLEEVTLSPMMGQYLSMIRNRKPDPATGQEPDENFAREIMQLFSVGLNALHPDGTLRLDAEGVPISTYTQPDIVGLAHIFTGWGPHYDDANPPVWSPGNIADRASWFQWGWDAQRPMTFYAAFHDTQPRAILGGIAIPGTLTGPERLARALDTIFNHPNTAPFVARQLIQRFVTSNPSPGYVYRVSQTFANDGSGVRGNLGATLRAVLLDSEARRADTLSDQGFGKPVEPLLRFTRLFRAFPLTPPKAGLGDARFFLNLQWQLPEQAPLHSPTVFNFFQPGYTPPGRIAAAGLVAPEFQILTETTVIAQTNLHSGTFSWGIWSPEPSGSADHSILTPDLAGPLAVLNAPGRTAAQAQGDLVDYLDTRLLSGRMSAMLRARILAVFTSLPTWYDYTAARQRERVRTALYLVATSPEFAVQR